MNRPRVLLAWEYGHNFGHLACLRAVAEWAEVAGYEPVWVLPAMQRRAEAIADEQWVTFSAPMLARMQLKRKVYKSFADVLLSLGFGNPDALCQAVVEWQTLLNQVSPSLIVLDYAPIARLATYLFGWYAVQVSNGFDAPPKECPPFGFGFGVPQIEQINAQDIAQLDRSISAVARRLGASHHVSLAYFLEYPQRLVTRIAEADPYGARSEVEYIGPIGTPARVEPAVWPDVAENRTKVFAYLRNTPLLLPALAALVRHGVSVLCVCPDISADVDVSSLEPFVRVVKQPVSIGGVMQQACGVVSYGSTTLVCQSLLAGKPQLMVPADVEKWMVSQRVTRIGAGAMVRKSGDLDRAVAKLFDRSVIDAARVVADRYISVNWKERFDSAMERIFKNPNSQ